MIWARHLVRTVYVRGEDETEVTYAPNAILFWVKCLTRLCVNTLRKLFQHGAIVRCIVASYMTDLQILMIVNSRWES
jgi:hypothetical protein